MSEEQRHAAQQALADHYREACRIDDTKRVRMLSKHSTIAGLDNAFWVLVDRPNRVKRTVIMIEVDGTWNISEVPWQGVRV